MMFKYDPDKHAPQDLVGTFFHTRSDEGRIRYQGVVKSYNKRTRQWTMVLFEWFMGLEGKSMKVSHLAIEELNFDFYTTDVEMQDEYKRYSRELDHQHRREYYEETGIMKPPAQGREFDD